MEPFSALGLMLAQFGARRIVGALSGDDVGGLAAGVLGLFAQIEQSQTQLIEIQRQMHAVLDQHYVVSLKNGTRYLRQSAIEGRPHAARREDLSSAANELMDASHAANTPTQAAMAERLLLFVQLGLGEQELARAAWQELDGRVGDAIAEAFTRYEEPWDEARRRIELHEFGQLRGLDRIRSIAQPDPRWGSAWSTVKGDAGASMTKMADLLADSVSAAELVGIDLGLTPTLRERNPLEIGSLHGTRGGPVHATTGGRVVVEVPLNRQVRVAGVTATLQGVTSIWSRPGDSSDYVVSDLSAHASLDRRRQLAAPSWVLAGAEHPSQENGVRPALAEIQKIQPGGSAAFVTNHYASPAYPPRRMVLAVGGLVLSARLELEGPPGNASGTHTR